jgi:hypothetical protein
VHKIKQSILPVSRLRMGQDNCVGVLDPGPVAV